MSDGAFGTGRRTVMGIAGAGALALTMRAGAAAAQAQGGAQAPKRVLVTGSSDGIGLAAARQLIGLGHRVVLHGRNQRRADDAMAAAPGAEAVVTGDLSVLAQTRALADQANRIGPCDAMIHNAGIGPGTKGDRTADGLPPIFAVNVLAPYVLTALVARPKRLVYLGSSAHRGARVQPDDLPYASRPWDGGAAYAESKLQDILLAFAVARRWPGVLSNAMDPGWVPTRMGGAGAPDSLAEGAGTETWLAVSEEAGAKVSGRYFRDRREQAPIAAAHDRQLQDRLMAACEQASGIRFPA